MKRILAVFSVALVLAVTALAQALNLSAKSSCCPSDCCQGGCCQGK